MKYANQAAKSRAWRAAHPRQARRASRRWRIRNRKAMALLNKRVKTHHRLCVLLVKQKMPQVYEELRKKAKSMVPIILMLEN